MFSWWKRAKSQLDYSIQDPRGCSQKSVQKRLDNLYSVVGVSEAETKLELN